MKSRLLTLLGPLLLIGLFGVWGIRWGLPSQERTNLFLPPPMRTPEFFDQVAKAREDLYAKMGGNPVAYFGRLAKQGQSNNLPTLLNSYSSFLLKTHSLDEAGTLVLLSKINPLKNRWYPSSFIYGGAYLYPLGLFLGAAHGLHWIRLVSSPLYYYAHPEAIAAVYTALRLWSVVGLLIAATALFFLAERLIGRSGAIWAMLFFGLSPTCIAHTKFAKPHTWAGGLSLWAVYFAVKASENPERRKCLMVGSLLLGLALGMTVTQVVFLPFLLWAAWVTDWPRMARRMAVVFAIMAGTFLLTNFYLLAHLRDYFDERFFLSHYAPFRVNLAALAAFFTSSLRVSLGWELWILAMAGFAWTILQTERPVMRHLSLLLAGVITYVAFQTQQQSGLPLTTRLFLAIIGLLCVPACAITFRWGRFGVFCRGICLAALIIKGGLYNAHFASDKAPRDNASLAALWVQQHIPERSVIGQPLVGPQIDCFPPIDFARYQVVTFTSDLFARIDGPVYAIISPQDTRWRPLLKEMQFLLLARFSESPLQKRGYQDPFTWANFPVEIYGRNIPG